MDIQKYRKLENYAAELANVGEGLEKEGEKALAIEKYLKLVDVLLIMADGSPDYPSWVKVTDKAAAYQKKIKLLIASAALELEKEASEHVGQNQPLPSNPPKNQ